MLMRMNATRRRISRGIRKKALNQASENIPFGNQM
jgi:hypothetical protein